MPVAEPKLTRIEVKRIKRRIVAKEPLSKIASDHNVGYMTIYKIAIGATWKKVKPRGRLIGVRDYSSTRTLSPSRCEAIALLKIRKRISFDKISARIGTASPATVRRAAENGYALLGIRLLKHRTQGTLKQAQAKLELTEDEVDDLIRAGAKKGLPRWVRKAAHDDDEEE